MTMAPARSRGVDCAPRSASTTASSGSVMCTRSAAGHRIARRRRDRRAERLERARLRLGAVPHRHRVAAPQHPFDHRAAQQPGSDETPRSPSRASQLESTPVLRRAHSLRSSDASLARELAMRWRESGVRGRLRRRRSRRRGLGAAAACCAGPATRKAARRLSRPIPSHPDQLVGFDVEIAELLARGLGRDAAVRQRHVRRRSISRSRAATPTSA